MFCPDCGKEIPAGSNFCLFCGAKLDRVKRFLQENTQDNKINGTDRPETGNGSDTRGEAVAWIKKGDLYNAGGNDEDAVRCYTTAIGLDPSNYDAWNKKAELLVRLGRIMEARICNENIIRLRGGVSPVIQERKATGERYIGGLSSPSLKLGTGKGADLAGAIGSNVGGYGIYATDKRLFILKNQKHVFGHPKGPALGGFVREELFGGTVDESIKSIEELEIYKEMEIQKEDILRIELKSPVLLSGSLSITTNSGEFFRLFIDHKSLFAPLKRLMLKFDPERTRVGE
ncbi:MAG TPA: tetratricopeptide repeat protein [Methanoregulaceae archaeon]|nr:tetratricopeptide repeat protein [Methanoregulaceae archaeon]